jgi:lactoylglutathione lyase/glyoxylase I family protein
MPIELGHDHVAIRAVDYASTLAWYQDKLDFTVDQEWPFGDMQLAYLSNGTAKIEILGGSTAASHATINSVEDSLGVEGYHHLCLNVADVDATLAELRSRGVEILGDAFDLDAIHRRLGFFKDNNGNVIELASPLS